MKYITVDSSEDRQKRKREDIDARPVLPYSMEIQPVAAKIIRNFSFGSRSDSSTEKVFSSLELGIVPKRNGSLPSSASSLSKSPDATESLQSPAYCASEEDSNISTRLDRSKKMALVSDYSSSDSD